jgi:predicted ArsR family transcriptional regulator
VFLRCERRLWARFLKTASLTLVTDRLTALADLDLRAMVLFARGEAEPFTADRAAAALGVHHNVARARLDRLVTAGLLDVSLERRTGRTGPGAGRPAKVYRVAPETSAIEFPQRRFSDLVGRLLDELPARGREGSLRRVGEQFGRDLAAAARLHASRGVPRGLERMCAAVRSLGFQASLERVDGETATIATPTCPLRPLVIQRPDAAYIDRGMWAGLVECALRGVRAEHVQCETKDCLNGHASCVVTLKLDLKSS